MSRPVRTTTPQGEEIVILSAAEYERLLDLAEDAHDVAVAERALAEYKANPAGALSHEEMLALLDAPTPISFWRRKRGLTQAALARQVGVTQAYLAQIEGGKRMGRLGLYSALGRVLGVDIERLDPTPNSRSSARPKTRRKG